MKRKPIIAGNWKMNMTPSGAVKLVKELVPLVKDADCDVVICPPFVDIPAVCGILENTDIKIGAQTPLGSKRRIYRRDKRSYAFRAECKLRYNRT